ncbi:MAG: hypothetical protein O3A46_17340, partial [Candidatus Poribacteria bacterium]|nr:hypothetical protein [Candidatus Poribacteria bacterium]
IGCGLLLLTAFDARGESVAEPTTDDSSAVEPTRMGVRMAQRDRHRDRHSVPIGSNSGGHGLKILGEIVVGTGAGVAGLLLPIAVSEGDGEGTVEGIVPLIGWWLGTVLGVYGIGTLGDDAGSFGATLLGALPGMALTIVVIVATISSNDESPVYFAMLTPAIGATIAFNLTRRPKEASSAALLDVRGGVAHLNVPQVYTRRDLFEKNAVTRNVNLLSVGF